MGGARDPQLALVATIIAASYRIEPRNSAAQDLIPRIEEVLNVGVPSRYLKELKRAVGYMRSSSEEINIDLMHESEEEIRSLLLRIMAEEGRIFPALMNQLTVNPTTASEILNERLKGEVTAYRSYDEDDVIVYLSTSDPQPVGTVRSALEEIFKNEDLDLNLSFGPIVSSWFAGFRVSARRGLAREEVKSRLQKLEHAVQVAALDRPLSEVNVNHADAVERLLRALDSTDQAAMLIGSVVLVKTTGLDGRTGVVAKTLTTAELNALHANAHLMASPATLLERLQTLVSKGDEHSGLSGAEGQPQVPPVSDSRFS